VRAVPGAAGAPGRVADPKAPCRVQSAPRLTRARPPGGFSVFAGVGERTREGNDLYREMIESGVIKLGDKARHAAAPLRLRRSRTPTPRMPR
jgi:hypothetical protein